ncbi:MAG: FliH/SctL family protein [bacterium]
MSSIWKRPMVSRPVLLTTSSAVTQYEGEPEDPRCLECQERLATTIEANLLATIRLKATALEREARQKAVEILSEAEEEAQRLRQEAAQIGEKEGYEAGYAAGQAASEKLLEEAKEILEQTKQECSAARAALEPQAVDLALELARLILQRDVQIGPAAIKELLAKCAGKIPKGTEVTLEVAPGELPQWQEAQKLVQEALGDRPFSLKEKAIVPSGQFILASPLGSVDARWETQLESCRDRLLREDTHV